jgi:hypothetical protein
MYTVHVHGISPVCVYYQYAWHLACFVDFLTCLNLSLTVRKHVQTQTQTQTHTYLLHLPPSAPAKTNVLEHMHACWISACMVSVHVMPCSLSCRRDGRVCGTWRCLRHGMPPSGTMRPYNPANLFKPSTHSTFVCRNNMSCVTQFFWFHCVCVSELFCFKTSM